MVLLANKKMALAQRSINRAIALDPKDPSQHYHAAQILAASGDKQGAVAILNPLLQTGVGFPEKGVVVNKSNVQEAANVAVGVGNTANMGSIQLKDTNVEGVVVNKSNVKDAANVAVGVGNKANMGSIVVE